MGLNPEYVLEIDWDHVKEDYIPENEEEDFLAHFLLKTAMNLKSGYLPCRSSMTVIL